MEHIVRSIASKPDLSEYIEGGFEEDGDDLEDIAEEGRPEENGSGTSRRITKNGDDMTPEMEERLIKGVRNSKRFSSMSIADVADRHLRDKTDAIAHIIRNISDQCAAAVEGLQLAHDADAEAEELAMSQSRKNRNSNISTITTSDDGQSASDVGDDSMLHPSGRASSIPPTPDLIHNRSSTAMSIASSVTTPERGSQQWNIGSDVPTKIVEDSDEEIDRNMHEENSGNEVVTKTGLLQRPAGARVSRNAPCRNKHS